MSTHTCCYALHTATKDEPATYCNQPTKYRIVLDDDGNKVRRYDIFCPEHRAKVDAMPDDVEGMEI